MSKADDLFVSTTGLLPAIQHSPGKAPFTPGLPSPWLVGRRATVAVEGHSSLTDSQVIVSAYF